MGVEEGVQIGVIERPLDDGVERFGRVRPAWNVCRWAIGSPPVVSLALQGSGRLEGASIPESWDGSSTSARVGSSSWVSQPPPVARVHDDIVRLVHRGVSLQEFAHAAAHTLKRAVPFEGTCLLTVDPATLLPTGEVVEHALPPAARVRLTEIELGEPDFNKFAALAQAPRPGGQPERRDRWRPRPQPPPARGSPPERLRRRAAHGPRRPHGHAGAALHPACREAGRPDFTPAEVRFVASLATVLADGVRRATLLDGGRRRRRRSDTGFLVLAADDTVELANDGGRAVDRRALPARPAGRPAARRRPSRHRPDPTHRSRRRRRPGQRPGPHPTGDAGLIVRGSLVGDDRVAVLFEAARPAELASAIADAYGLTERERAITQLVATRAGHHRDRRPPPPLGVHRAGPPEGDLRQVRRPAHAASSSPGSSSTTTPPDSPPPRRTTRAPRRASSARRPRSADRSRSDRGVARERDAGTEDSASIDARPALPDRLPALVRFGTVMTSV